MYPLKYEILLCICNCHLQKANPTLDRGLYTSPFPKKGYLGLAKNYRGVALISIAAKVYLTPS